MKVTQFKAMLSTLAEMPPNRADPEAANALHKLAELFDGQPDQEVTKFVASILKARGLDSKGERRSA